MTTLMTWGDNDGTRGRCDAKCHGATGPVCHCMCGGRFHGAAHQTGGVEEAVRNTWEEVVQDAEDKAKTEGKELDTSGLRKFLGLKVTAEDAAVADSDWKQLQLWPGGYMGG